MPLMLAFEFRGACPLLLLLFSAFLKEDVDATSMPYVYVPLP